MVRWCSYCQTFLGEKAPFDDFAITHGICPHCAASGKLSRSETTEKIRNVQNIVEQLWSAGKEGNLDSAAHIIDQALALDFRPVDILLGFITPALYHVGQQWESGKMTVAGEHQFTALCEKITQLLDQKTKYPHPHQFSKVLIVNIEGNYHTLGVRVVSQWFFSQGFWNQMIYPGLPHDELIEVIKSQKPQCVAMSLSMKDHLQKLPELHSLIQRNNIHPQIPFFIGGYPIKTGNPSTFPKLSGFHYIQNLEDIHLSEQILKIAN